MMRTPRLLQATVAVAAVLAAACGGGNDDKPAVNGMAATSAAYGSDALWTVSGLNLDRGIGLTITTGTCDGLTEVPGGSAFQRRFSCRPRSLGDLVAQVNDAGGSRIASLRVVIPKPVVQLDVDQGTIDLELDPDGGAAIAQGGPDVLDPPQGGDFVLDLAGDLGLQLRRVRPFQAGGDGNGGQFHVREVLYPEGVKAHHPNDGQEAKQQDRRDRVANGPGGDVHWPALADGTCPS